MKTSHFMLSVLTMLLISSFPAKAQNYDNDDDVIYEIGSLELIGTDGEVGTILERVRPIEPNAVAKPKFAIRSGGNRFILSIGGNINPIVGYDIGNDLYNVPKAGMWFVPGDIPVPATSGHRAAFFINPLTTNLDFTVVGMANTPNEVTGYIMLTTGYNNKGVILKRAYVTYREVTAGITLTNFDDVLASQPPTIDPQGPCGIVCTSTYSVFYNSKSYKGVAFGAGIEMPTFYNSDGIYRGHDYRHDFGGTTVTADASQKAPDIPAYIEYAPSKQNRVRASAVVRNFFYRDLVADKSRHALGWGAQFSGNFSFWKPLTFNFQAVYGKGLGCYIQDLEGRALSFTPKSDKPGEMQANPMMGVTFGASYNITPKLQVNAVGSYARVWDVEDYATANDNNGVASLDNYRYGIYATANCFYNITPYLQWGFEYNYGRHETWNMGGANDHRLMTRLRFQF